jgi:hypothetical protein
MQEVALIVNLTGYVRDTIYIMKDTIEREIDISKNIDSKQAGRQRSRKDLR